MQPSDTSSNWHSNPSQLKLNDSTINLFFDKVAMLNALDTIELANIYTQY